MKGPAPRGSTIPARSVLARDRRRRRTRRRGRRAAAGWASCWSALVGINVYVFFFNRGTAPREILNLQSTSKTFESTRQEALAADVRKAPASCSRRRRAPRPRRRGRAGRRRAREPAQSRVGSAGRRPRPRRRRSRSRSRRRPSRSRCARPAAPPRDPDPVRPAARGRRPRRRRARPASRRSSPPPTRSARCWRARGSAAPAPKVIAALAKLVDPRTIRGGQKYVVRAGDDGTPDGVRVPAHAGAALPRRGGRRRGRAAGGRRASWRRPSRSRPPRRAAPSSRRSTNRCRRRASRPRWSSLLVELFAWDVNFYIDTHPGDHWKVVDREAVPGRPVLQVRARAGGRVRRQGRHLPRLLLGGQGRRPRPPGQVLRRARPGALEEHAEDAAALRAHQLEVRSQALPPDPARREGAPRHRLRGAGRDAGVGVGQRARRRGRDEARLGQHHRHRPHATGSRPATTTCRSSRAACTSASR